MAETTLLAPGTTTARPAGIGRRAVRLIRRLPFTTAVVLTILVVGGATGSLWTPIAERSWFPDVAYGLPSFVEGAWWTPLTGSFLALTPAFYVAVVGSFLAFVGFTEWRLGTGRTALICVGGQLVGVLAAALTLFALQDSAWSWAEIVATARDAGFSAGALACIAATSAAVRSPWRLRLRAALFVYVIVSFLFLGSLADLEHLWAVACAVPLGRLLVGRHAVRSPGGRISASRREQRVLAATGLALIGAGELVLLLFPAHGPLGTAGGASSPWGVLLDVAVVVLLLDGLRKGRRWAWWGAMALGTLNVAAALVVVLGGTADGVAIAITAGVLWAAELVVLVSFRRAFRAPSRRGWHRRTSAEGIESDDVRRLLAQHGGGSLSWMATWPENQYFRDGPSLIAYRRHTRVAVVLGDPIGPVEARTAAVRAFTGMCEQTGMVPCLFSVTADTATLTDALGWQHVQVAEDTLIDLGTLEFRGKKWQDVRSALNRAGKEGISYREVTLAEEPWALRQVRSISEEWVGDKGLPEMGFTLGGVDEALDPAVRVGLAVDTDGKVHGFTSWLPVFGADGVVCGWTLDLTRRGTSGFRPVSEFLIASACLAFQAEGARIVSLSGAPLARADTSTKPPAVERLLDALGLAMEPLYGFRSLHAFKTKFQPRYEPMYLAYRDEGDLPRIGIALTKAYLPDSDMRDLVKLATHRGSG